MDTSIVFDSELIRRYDTSGPRYTSYPTAPQFHERFGEDEYRACAARSNTDAERRPLSLYFHLPFCDTVCFYCACNKVVTKNRGKSAPYLDRLAAEIAMQGELLSRDRVVNQLHWGGGTPTFLAHEEMRRLMRVTGEHFKLRNDDRGEYSIEIDPREVQADTIALLRELGFNRISMGVQDLDDRVQKAVNRIQPEAVTVAAINAARAHGFASVSVDLMYGLPLQTVASFTQTLQRMLQHAPDRFSVFNYAHLPERFKPQRRINVAELPSPDDKLRILEVTIETLTAAGYVYIGMDHFARPDDELAVAQREGTLYRNFQGYSTHAECDLVAMGITAISKIDGCFSQNVRTLDEYYARIDAGRLAVFRGIELSADDRLRQAVITQLICHFQLAFTWVETAHGIRFAEYFSDELAALRPMQDDGLVRVDAEGITVLPAGRLLIRNVCMVFDRYLRAPTQTHYSKVI